MPYGTNRAELPIFVFDTFELPRDGIQRFIPGDALEVPVAPFPDSFERMRQPVGMILPAQIGPPPRTGAQLRRSEGIRPVVGIQTDDAPVLDVRDQQAAPAAVVGRAANTDFLDGMRKAHIL